MKKFILIIYLLLNAAIYSSLFYYLPATNKVYLVGTEVKKEEQGGQLGDVRYVVARDIPTGETLMYRNQDMPWPPYLKFDSGDLSGKVMNFEDSNPDAIVLATHYGFRIPFLSLYPNITSIEKVDKAYDHYPLFNVIVIAFCLLLSIVGLAWLLKFKYPRQPE